MYGNGARRYVDAVRSPRTNIDGSQHSSKEKKKGVGATIHIKTNGRVIHNANQFNSL